MDTKVLYICVGLLVFVGLASAGQVEIHLLKTGNVTYVYTDDMSPKTCNSTCVVTYDDTNCSWYNDTVVEKLDNITLKVDVVRNVLASVQGNMSATMGALPSTSRIGEILDAQESSLSTYLSAVISDKMAVTESKLSSWFEKAAELDTAKTQVSQLQVDLANANGRVTIAEKNELDAKNLAESRMYIVYGALAIAGLMFAISFNLLNVIPKKIKGG